MHQKDRSDAGLPLLRVAIGLSTANSFPRSSKEAEQIYRSKTAKLLREAFFSIADLSGASILFECGAHEAAASTTFCATAGKRAVAIEANPITFRLKTSAVACPAVTALNRGLGDAEGVATFHVPKGELAPGNASFLRKPGRDYTSFEVAVETLDKLAQTYVQPEDVIALWVDVEGLALNVSKGAEALLRDNRCQVVMIEVETKSLWLEQALEKEVNEFMLTCGMTPILRDLEFPGQHNLIYVRAGADGRFEETIISFWQAMSRVRVSWRELAVRKVRNALGAAKERVSRRHFPTLWKAVNVVAARLGSISSKEDLWRDEMARNPTEEGGGP